MEKKISFSFSKLTKKPSVFTKPPKEEKKIELVECFEGQTIKIKDAVEEVYTPLIIPIKDNAKNLLDRVRDAKAKQSSVLKNEVKEEVDERPDSELTIDELAARELIKEAKQRANNTETEKKVFVLPVKEEVVSLEGEKESTLEDYENIPVSDYGLAMLRGMGWKDGMGLGKNPSKTSLVAPPEVRPKGLGLGASRPIKPDILKQSTDKNGKELILIKGAFAKIIAGTHRGNYCEVQGLDDESGRVIVRTSLKGLVLTLNEFLVIPVTKEEYSMGSKVLNNAKYEEYKEKSDKNLEKARNGNGVQVIKVESSDEEEENERRRVKKEKSKYRDRSSSNDSHHKSRTNKSKQRRKSRKDKTKHRDRSRSSSSENVRKSKKKNRSKSRSSSDEYKRKSRKDKSKRRDKDRDSSSEDTKRRSRKNRN